MSDNLGNTRFGEWLARQDEQTDDLQGFPTLGLRHNDTPVWDCVSTNGSELISTPFGVFLHGN